MVALATPCQPQSTCPSTAHTVCGRVAKRRGTQGEQCATPRAWAALHAWSARHSQVGAYYQRHTPGSHIHTAWVASIDGFLGVRVCAWCCHSTTWFCLVHPPPLWVLPFAGAALNTTSLTEPLDGQTWQLYHCAHTQRLECPLLLLVAHGTLQPGTGWAGAASDHAHCRWQHPAAVGPPPSHCCDDPLARGDVQQVCAASRSRPAMSHVITRRLLHSRAEPAARQTPRRPLQLTQAVFQRHALASNSKGLAAPTWNMPTTRAQGNTPHTAPQVAP
jgi:hypothetical protein